MQVLKEIQNGAVFTSHAEMFGLSEDQYKIQINQYREAYEQNGLTGEISKKKTTVKN